MRSSLRDAMLSFAGGTVGALAVFWFATALALRFPCSADCTASVASNRPTTQVADNRATGAAGASRSHAPRRDAARTTPAEHDRIGAGVYVAMAPAATASGAAPSPAVTEPAPTEAPAAAAPAPTATSERGGSLDGWWLVTNTADSSDRRTSTGQAVVYRVELHQDGERLSGKGATWSRNGRVLTPSQRTPIVATGMWRNDGLQLTLVEHATRGTRQIRVEWQPTADGDAFAGRFASEATHTMGRSEAVRSSSTLVNDAREEPARSSRHAPRAEPRRSRHRAAASAE
jgi:hypothetical protein